MRFSPLKLIPLLFAIIALSNCRKEEEVTKRTSGFDEFIPQYNTYIENWLKDQTASTEEEISQTEKDILASEEQERTALGRKLIAQKRELEKYQFRLGLGDYFRFAEMTEIPEDLTWVDGMEHEEIGDPRAKKGGTYNIDMRSFPATMRGFGDNANNSFRSTLYDSIDMGLVTLHPKSLEMIPGIARQWAVSKDGRTVYFRLNEDARYSDGIPVKASDYLFGSYIRISDDIVNPYTKQYYRENIAGLTVYDDHTLSISVPETQIYAPVSVGSLTPSPPHFYKDYGPDFKERYQWKFPPTTGAYKVKEGDLVKGISITQTRVKNWWAKDNKYYKHRFNADRIRHFVVREESKSFELFRAGEIDLFYITRPEYWYEKSEMPPVFDGYINRYTFYHQYPALPRGFYINVARPLLEEKDIRIGIHHAMNWEKVIQVIFRGDYQRLNAFQEGFLLFSDPSIRARKYSITSAREQFKKAGFTKTGRDGILRREDGTKLSISITYPAVPILDRMFAILREEAKSCGMELRLDSAEPTVAYKKMSAKQHDMAFAGFLVEPPAPDFYQYIHSTNARDERGNLKPQTNNLFSWSRDDTDLLAEKARFSRTEEELRDCVFKLQKIIHDEAIFVPSYTTDFVRIGCWRWIRWPDSEETRFCPPLIFDQHETYVYWIDEDLKRETLEAKRRGKTFEEVNTIYDDYRSPTSSKTPKSSKEEREGGPE